MGRGAGGSVSLTSIKQIVFFCQTTMATNLIGEITIAFLITEKFVGEVEPTTKSAMRVRIPIRRASVFVVDFLMAGRRATLCRNDRWL